MAGLYQNQIPSLSKLNKFRYENIAFNKYR